MAEVAQRGAQVGLGHGQARHEEDEVAQLENGAAAEVVGQRRHPFRLAEEAAVLLFATPSSCGDPAHWEEEVVLPSAPPGLARRTGSMTPPLRRRSRKEQVVIYR